MGHVQEPEKSMGPEGAFQTQLQSFSSPQPMRTHAPKALDHLNMVTMASSLPSPIKAQSMPRRPSLYDYSHPMGSLSPANVYQMHSASRYSSRQAILPYHPTAPPPQMFFYPFSPMSPQFSHIHEQLPVPIHLAAAAQTHRVDPYAYHTVPPAHHPTDGATIHARYNSDPVTVPPSFPRGPPRKPKQSGHALWIGNLPPAATVIDLKDHFSRGATNDIESLFLISKSNCAFVNYRSEEACATALARFHDSRFQGVRLVCRLRRRSSGVDTGQSPLSVSPVTDEEGSQPPTVLDSPVIAHSCRAAAEVKEEDASNGEPPRPGQVREKFFIVKSLTLQDLDASVENGIWATQSHNERVLNQAFTEADNVYLVFSANKSGEYFGYARMASSIVGEVTAIQDGGAESHPALGDGPKTIPTLATATAPPGRVIDDSARGTIFWEAEDPGAEMEGEVSKETEGASREMGRPFKIEWISTSRLPFYRTRGLRNAWNANREVKIARDGTELEPAVGRRLLQLFHRPQQVPAVHPHGAGPYGMGIN